MNTDLNTPVLVTRGGRRFEPGKAPAGAPKSVLPSLIAAAAVVVTPAAQALAADLAQRAVARAHLAAEGLLVQLGLAPHPFD